MTLSSADAGVRRFWVDHGIACRRIGAGFGKALGSPCVTNVWVPDGMKDTPADRLAGRGSGCGTASTPSSPSRSTRRFNLDAIEGKLFGIGAESYTVGSHEFYLGYALTARQAALPGRRPLPPDRAAGRQADGRALTFLPEVLLHVSRGVRWDSDHVVTLGDDLLQIGREVVANGYERRVHVGLDFFDASINRVAAWVVGHAEHAQGDAGRPAGADGGAPTTRGRS